MTFFRYFIHTILVILVFIVAVIILTYGIIFFSGEGDDHIRFGAVFAVTLAYLSASAIFSAIIVIVDAGQSSYAIIMRDMPDNTEIMKKITHYAMYVANNTHVEDKIVDGNNNIVFSKKNSYLRWLTLPIIVSGGSDRISISGPKSHIRHLKRCVKKTIGGA